jgi:hypothetical protein
LREHEAVFRDRGVALAAIGLGDREHARRFREETGVTFPLLVDEGRQAYAIAGLGSGNLLHLLRRDNFQSRMRARAGGHRQRKPGKNPFQLGGSFIFAPGNIDRFAHVSKTFGDNATPATLLAALEQGRDFSR